MRRISMAAARRQRRRCRNHPRPASGGRHRTAPNRCGLSSVANRADGGVPVATTTASRSIQPRASVGTACAYPATASLSHRRRTTQGMSTLASVSCWLGDVLRTKRLSPPNPVLESLPKDGIDEGRSGLPEFSVLRPHHLRTAAEEISRQHDVDLAQLEVRWTTSVGGDGDSDEGHDGESAPAPTKPSSLSSLLSDLDRLTAPVVQLREVSELYETLASPPDKIGDWTEASESVDSPATRAFLENVYRSRIVYRGLAAAVSDDEDRDDAAIAIEGAPSFLVPFLKRGAHIGDDDAEGGDPKNEERAENLQQIEAELNVLNDRLDNVVSYERASKAMRLQCMSDMYNCIGLSRMQAESLLPPSPSGGNDRDDDDDDDDESDSVWRLARLQHGHMVESPSRELTGSLFPELAVSLEPFLPKRAVLDLEGVGAFLEGKSEVGNAINSGSAGGADTARASLKARYDFKQRVRLHGVLRGLTDFCDQILGIEIVEDTEANNEKLGWSKNVRLLHLYEKKTGAEGGSDKDDDDDRDAAYLGTIYFDPFADSYWRTEEANQLVRTRLFSQQAVGQTTAPVAVVALKVTPIWDDTPVPVTWSDTRDLLGQFGRALQLVLDQSRQRRRRETNDPFAMAPAPIDTSDVLGHFLELWLQNDGFLHRLVQLSQDELVLDDETIETLRKDLRSEKALDLTNTMFLSALQFSVFERFDPRGDETLVALQERLARHHLPGSNLPDPSDLSPLLAVFQQSGIDQKLSAYGTLWSEVLAATVYEAFQRTDLRDRSEVARLGTGIRDLFLRGGGRRRGGGPPSRSDFADLCRIDDASVGSAGPLARVHGFDVVDDDDVDDEADASSNPGSEPADDATGNENEHDDGVSKP